MTDNQKASERMRYREFLLVKGVPCDDDAISDAAIDYVMSIDSSWWLHTRTKPWIDREALDQFLPRRETA